MGMIRNRLQLTRLGWAGLCVLVLGLCQSFMAHGQGGFLSRISIRGNGSPQDLPHIATDGTGTWIVTWTSNEDFLSLSGLLGVDDDILSSRSLDNGATWSTPIVVNTDDAALDDILAIASEVDAKSAGDGNGNWITVWSSESPVLDLGKGILGPPEVDIHFSLSSDNGATWVGPKSLEDNTAGLLNTHGVSDNSPQILYDGNSDWLLIWSAQDGDLFLTNDDADLFTMRSTNGGGLWSDPQILNATATGDSGDDTHPAVATDGAGTIIAVWESNEISLYDQPLGPDIDIFVAASNDFGQSWGLPAILSNTSADDGLDESRPAIATDMKGTWIAAWESTSAAGSAGTDADVRYAVSTDNGVSWSLPSLLNTNATTDGASSDRTPSLASDGFGTWICTWTTDADIGNAGTDDDIVFAVSIDDGATWSDPQIADPAAATIEPLPFDALPSVAADRTGHWVAAWTKGTLINLNVQSGIAGAQGVFTGSLEGRVVNGPYPIPCAALVAESLDSGIERMATTDRSGAYRFDNLPVGTYRVSVYAPEHLTQFQDVVINGGVDGEQNFALFRGPLKGGVFGQVLDADTGQPPLVSVRVEASIGGVPAGVTYTCASGEYELRLETGKGVTTEIALTFSQDGYDPLTTTTTVHPPANAEVNATLEKAVNAPATMAGIVRASASAQPIAGARVTIQGRINISTNCNSSGVYLFDTLPEGVYTVRASAKGFLGATQSIAASYLPSQLEFALETDPAAAPNRADVNGDASVNAVDVQLVINAVLGLETGYLADLNDDGQVNAADVQGAINAALNF